MRSNMVGLMSLMAALGSAPQHAKEARADVSTLMNVAWDQPGWPLPVANGTANIHVPRGRRISYRAQQRAAQTRRNRRLHHGRGR